MSHNQKYNSLINSWEWQKLRGRKLTAQPLCEECEKHGRIRAATEVHHIVPVESEHDLRAMKTLAYDWCNLMSLCHQCHKDIHDLMAKTRRRRGKVETKQQKKYNMAVAAQKFAERWLPQTKREENNGNIQEVIREE